jgi:CheY-like chemotaxis protein
VAAAIVREHGGSIGVESSGVNGEGSLYYIELPIIDSSSVSELFEPKIADEPEIKFLPTSKVHSQVFPMEDEGPSTLPLVYHRAVVVDDSHLVRKMLSKSLVNQFRVIDQACDGVEAVDLIKRLMEAQETINVIFLDSFMPKMGGIEACKQIRAMGYHGVIIAISGNVIQDDIDEFLAAGADRFVGKPFKLDHLHSVLTGERVGDGRGGW